MGVKRSVCGKQGFRRGIANQQAAALNIGGQLRQAVQLIRAEQFPADLYAVGTGTGGHAVCLVSDGGVELLIHIGIDTVNLKGKHFAIKVKEGDKVKAGDLLAEVDVAAVRAEGYKTTTPNIVTNSDDYLDVFAAAESGSIRHGDKLLTVIKKG